MTRVRFHEQVRHDGVQYLPGAEAEFDDDSLAGLAGLPAGYVEVLAPARSGEGQIVDKPADPAKTEAEPTKASAKGGKA